MWVYYWVSYWYSVLHWECLPPFRAICFVGPSGQSSTHINVPQGRHVRVCVRAHIHVRVPLIPGCRQTSYHRSQTHRHTDTQSLSLARSLSAVFNPRFKASEERHVCVRVCMHGITPSIPPLPLSRTRTSDTPDTPRPAQAHLIPSILFVRNAGPTFPNSCRSSLYRYIDA